jgi:NDP-sugar pyrophosphorylase family protein
MFLMGGGRHLETNKEDYPLYLTEIGGKLILERQIDYCKTLNPQRFLFCLKSSDIKSFRVDFIIKQLVPESRIIIVDNATKGAICTALLSIEYINNDEELIIMSVDDFVEESGETIINAFRKNNSDAGVVSFNSIHPRYSFVRLNDKEEVVELAEKRPISKSALASFYYFKKGIDFTECAKEVIRKDNPVNGAFYISQALNEMILKQKKVALYKISNDKFHPLKTEAQFAQYLSELNEQKTSK